MISFRYLSRWKVESYGRDCFELIENAFSQARVEIVIASIEGSKSLQDGANSPSSTHSTTTCGLRRLAVLIWLVTFAYCYMRPAR
jgi:hypothetical protein